MNRTYSDRTASKAEGRLRSYNPEPNKRANIPPHLVPEYVAYWHALDARMIKAHQGAFSVRVPGPEPEKAHQGVLS